MMTPIIRWTLIYSWSKWSYTHTHTLLTAMPYAITSPSLWSIRQCWQENTVSLLSDIRALISIDLLNLTDSIVYYDETQSLGENQEYLHMPVALMMILLRNNSNNDLRSILQAAFNPLQHPTSSLHPLIH